MARTIEHDYKAKNNKNTAFRHSIVASIPACHAGDQGSIPCVGTFAPVPRIPFFISHGSIRYTVRKRHPVVQQSNACCRYVVKDREQGVGAKLVNTENLNPKAVIPDVGRFVFVTSQSIF
jgi:hypothetical protein